MLPATTTDLEEMTSPLMDASVEKNHALLDRRGRHRGIAGTVCALAHIINMDPDIIGVAIFQCVSDGPGKVKPLQ